MAVLYPWATREYLLWRMNLPQLMYYYNKGIELKYPRPPQRGQKPGLSYRAKDVKREIEAIKRFTGYKKQYGQIEGP